METAISENVVKAERCLDGIYVDTWENKTSKPSYPPILMVHGMFGGGWYFEDWARFLCQKGFNVYAIKDMHLFYRDISRVKFSDYVLLVWSVIKRLTLRGDFKRDPIILGHSMGGLLAQKIAADYPSLVSGIILVASAPPKGISAMSWNVAKAMAKHLIPLILNRPLKIDRKTTFNLLLGGSRDDETSYPDEDWYDESQEQIFQKLVPESPMVAKQLAFGQIVVDEINCPSLVVAGVFDNLLPLRLQIAIAEKYKSEYLSFLAGHMLPLEDKRCCENEIINSIHKWIYSNFIS